MIDPQEIEATWSLFGKLGVLLAAIVAFIKAWEYLRSKTSVAKLEDRVTQHDVYFDNDKKRLDQLEKDKVGINKRLDDIELKRDEESERINESLTMLGVSLVAIINHMIDGEGKEELKHEREELQNFFIKR